MYVTCYMAGSVVNTSKNAHLSAATISGVSLVLFLSNFCSPSNIFTNRSEACRIVRQNLTSADETMVWLQRIVVGSSKTAKDNDLHLLVFMGCQMQKLQPMRLTTLSNWTPFVALGEDFRGCSKFSRRCTTSEVPSHDSLGATQLSCFFFWRIWRAGQLLFQRKPADMPTCNLRLIV